MKIGIIGAGWNGSHCALELTKAGHQVVLLEKNADIFQGVSGEFGIRLHKGPHYPRSKPTRDACLKAFDRFCTAYPELVVAHESAIYAQGTTDALGMPSKVSTETFAQVCHESPECQEIDLGSSEFDQLQAAFNLEEPSVVLGDRLRAFFRNRLQAAGVQIITNFSAQRIVRSGNVNNVYRDNGSHFAFDLVINTTGFTSLLPERFEQDFPFDVEVVYQPCLGLRYEDLQPAEKPLSFIVMDGWFPCLMPTIAAHGAYPVDYILTHGSYTIMGSFPSVEAAKGQLAELTDNFIASTVKPLTEAEMCRFWPEFSRRFSYKGWKGAVLAKLKTRSEFRSAVTFEKDRVIYIFPGKISNVFDASDEILTLIAGHPCIEHNGYRYAANGVLHRARQEIQQKPKADEANTCNLQTYSHMRGRKRTETVMS